jgi:hypothetical protein
MLVCIHRGTSVSPNLSCISVFTSDLKTHGWSIKAIPHAELCRLQTSDTPGQWFFAVSDLHQESSVRSMQILMRKCGL